MVLKPVVMIVLPLVVMVPVMPEVVTGVDEAVTVEVTVAVLPEPVMEPEELPEAPATRELGTLTVVEALAVSVLLADARTESALPEEEAAALLLRASEIFGQSLHTKR